MCLSKPLILYSLQGISFIIVGKKEIEKSDVFRRRARQQAFPFQKLGCFRCSVFRNNKDNNIHSTRITVIRILAVLQVVRVICVQRNKLQTLFRKSFSKGAISNPENSVCKEKHHKIICYATDFFLSPLFHQFMSLLFCFVL